ncbi:hypothetical protein HanIR_Chr11g0553891 [Helianthus annuus]|nr:hypothetical protein HanIR_Chr11g0553891 [Helianthus annuus]
MPTLNSLPTNQPQAQILAAHYARYNTPSPPIYSPQSTAPAAPPGFVALNPSELSAAFNTMQLNYTDPNLIMDTGAERHVTKNRGMIPNLSLSNVNTKLMVGNGQYLPIEGSGTGFLPIQNRTYILPNILYSP